jgi:hypothetical protein
MAAFAIMTPSKEEARKYPQPSQHTLLPPREIIATSGRFDEAFYRRSYGEGVPRHLSPLDHFLAVGHDEGLLASPHFDPIVYKLRHPIRRHENALVDSILKGDEADYRDIAASFRDVEAEMTLVTIRYPMPLRSEWSKNAGVVAENVDRSVRMAWRGSQYELRNPSPASVLSRLAEDRSFCFARLPHGFWDDYHGVRKLARRLRNHPRCRNLNSREIFNIAIRLQGRMYLDGGTTCVEGFLAEVEGDLRRNPKDDDFWTAVALKGVPTFDDSLEGYNEEDVEGRLELLAEFFHPSERLYDATLWKRWALSGDMARLAEAARDHPVILVAPARLRSLGRKWGLPQFRPIVIPPDHSYLLRHELLAALGGAIEAILAAKRGAAPIVFFQCGGELSYWLMLRLRPRYPKVFYIDVGQAIDLWCWQPREPWLIIYGDFIRAANPFADSDGDGEDAAAEPSEICVGTVDGVNDMVRRDYMDTGLMALPEAEPMMPIAGPFERRGANGWQTVLPVALVPVTDHEEGRRRSPLILLEDGKILGRGHGGHDDIFAIGRGRYSFWKRWLYFSTSDNSDPNRNGRAYTIGRIGF